MYRSRTLRSLAGLSGLAAALLWRVPTAPVPVSPTWGTAPIVTHQDIQGRALLYGTLAALHPATRTGDLALPDGTLLPLRFTLVDQMRGLRVGDELAVGAEGHGHGRLLVRMVEHGEFSKHWRAEALSKHWRGEDWSKHWRAQDFSKHWRSGDYSKHWRVRGVVARTLGHGDAEVLGVDGAATVVHVSGASVTGAPAGASSGAGAVYAEGRPTLVSGMAIDAQVVPAGAGTATVSTARIVAARAVGMDVEGRVAAVDRASGTLTIVDENGQPTRIALGGRTSGYGVGQSVEAWGRFGDTPGVPNTSTFIADTTAEHEDPTVGGAQDQGGQGGVVSAPTAATPATAPTPAFVIPVGTATPSTGPDGSPQPSPTPAFIIPVATTMAIGTPTMAAAASATATPAFIIPVAPTASATATNGSSGRTPTSVATAVATPAAAATRAATPPATDTATPIGNVTATPVATGTPTPITTRTAMASSTATNTASATRTPMSTPTATLTSSATPTSAAMSTPTATPTSAASATPTSTATASATPTGTDTPMPTSTATSSSTPTSTATSTATATPTSTQTPQPSATDTGTPQPSATDTATAGPALTTQQSCAATATAIAASPAPATATVVPTNTPDASGNSVRAQYEGAKGDQACGTQLQPKFRIYNDGSAPVQLSGLKIRYYFDYDGGPTPPWFPSSSGSWTLNIYPASTPVPGADTYLEDTYSGAGTINPGAFLDVPLITACKPVAPNTCTGGLNWNQYNDYSYDGSARSYQDWERVTLYYNGALMWGNEPR